MDTGFSWLCGCLAGLRGLRGLRRAAAFGRPVPGGAVCVAW